MTTTGPALITYSPALKKLRQVEEMLKQEPMKSALARSPELDLKVAHFRKRLKSAIKRDKACRARVEKMAEKCLRKPDEYAEKMIDGLVIVAFTLLMEVELLDPE